MAVVALDYTNWKGERSQRRVVPIRIYFGSTEYHTEEQFLLEALDIDKGTNRTFAMKDIHNKELLNFSVIGVRTR